MGTRSNHCYGLTGFGFSAVRSKVHDTTPEPVWSTRHRIPGDVVNKATTDLPDNQRSAIRRFHAANGQSSRNVCLIPRSAHGTNPASATDWAWVGLYSMSPPRGKKCHVRAGGDVIIGTDEGAIPLSAVITKDPTALRASAISAAIEDSWRKFSRTWDGVQPWEMIK